MFIWYCCLRNQLRGVFKQTFAVPSVPPPIELREDMFRDSPGSPGQSISSLKRPGMRNSPDDPVRLVNRYVIFIFLASELFSQVLYSYTMWSKTF